MTQPLSSIEALQFAYEQLLNHCGDGVRELACIDNAIFVVDHVGQIVLTNTAYDELAETFGGDVEPADAPGQVDTGFETPRKRAARRETFHLDFPIASDAGDPRWFEATGRPLPAGDAAAGIVVVREILDRGVRMLQEEFLAWAAHELRTPLTLFSAYVQLAERRVGPDGDPRLLYLLARASEQSHQQAAVIDSLLEVTRLKNGRLSLRTDTVDVAVLATHVVDVIEILTQGQELTLSIEDGALFVTADGGRLEQVLLNLLTNAIAHAPGTDQIDVSIRRDGAFVTITIRDHGPGIPAEKMQHMFTRHIPESQPEPSEQRGLGLGLYIAREIIRAHGGTITVESVLGEGAAFTVRLPLSLPSPA